MKISHFLALFVMRYMVDKKTSTFLSNAGNPPVSVS